MNQLRNKIKRALKQEEADPKQKDGMNISLCVINQEKMQLEYAGAYNSLYLIRNKSIKSEINIENNKMKISENDNYLLYDIKADKQPIAVYINEKPFHNEYTN